MLCYTMLRNQRDSKRIDTTQQLAEHEKPRKPANLFFTTSPRVIARFLYHSRRLVCNIPAGRSQPPLFFSFCKRAALLLVSVMALQMTLFWLTCLLFPQSTAAQHSSVSALNFLWSQFGEAAVRTDSRHANKRNVILMISDGMGVHGPEAARKFLHGTSLVTKPLYLEQHLLGRLIPHASRPQAGPLDDTAIACAIDADNDESVGLLASGLACGSLLEAAKHSGRYLTGMVVTASVTDDTPAAFSAHVRDKKDRDRVAQHQLGDYPLGQSLDLMIGGGRCHFLPASAVGGCRRDSVDLWEQARARGWTLVDGMDQYRWLDDGRNASLPLMALMAPNGFPYEADRDDYQVPSLESMTRTAIQALAQATQNSTQGFFLMVEGSRIDDAAHNNELPKYAKEVVAFDKAFQTAMEFAKSSDVETIIISTSNHDTGGIRVGQTAGARLPAFVNTLISNLLQRIPVAATSLLNPTFSSHHSLVKLHNELFQKYIAGARLSKHELEYVTQQRFRGPDRASLLRIATADRTQELSREKDLVSWSTDQHTTDPIAVYGYSNRRKPFAALRAHFAGTGHGTARVANVLERLMNVSVGEVTYMLNQVLDTDEPPIHGSFKGLMEGMLPREHWTGKIWLKPKFDDSAKWQKGT